MHCRLVYKITDLCPGFCTLHIGKALELVDDQVGGFEVLKPVCEKVDLCEKQEALLDVYVLFGKWSGLFRTLSFRIVKSVRPKPRLFLRVVMPSIVFWCIATEVESLNSEIDAIQISGEDCRVLVVQACRLGEVCPFRLASCLEETRTRDQNVGVNSKALCWCFADFNFESPGEVMPELSVSSFVNARHEECLLRALCEWQNLLYVEGGP
jgi:hypothetical protein